MIILSLQKMLRGFLCFINRHEYRTLFEYKVHVRECLYCKRTIFMSDYGFWTKVKNRVYLDNHYKKS